MKAEGHISLEDRVPEGIEIIAKIGKASSAEKPLAIFDLDSTLNNLHEVMSESFKTHLNQDKDHTSWDTYHLSETYGLPYDSILMHIEEQGLLDLSSPLPGAKELIDSIKPNYDVGILTARGCFQRPVAHTCQWLLKNNLIPHWVEIVKTNKSRYIKQRFGQCDFFLDDCPEHLISVLETGVAKQVGTLNYSWTRSLPKEIIRFDSLSEVKMYLEDHYRYEVIH